VITRIRRDERRLQQFRRLTDVSRALTYATTLEEVLQLATERAAELLETPKSVLLLTDEEGVLSVRASFGVASDPTQRCREPLTEALINQLQELLGVTSDCFLGVPLVVGGEVTGLLAVALEPGTKSTAEEREWLLSAVADQAAVALEKMRLDERGKFRDRLIGIVSHDLRNPIGVVLLGASVLLEHNELDEHTTKVLSRIRSSAERATRMIADLLDYTQAHLGDGIHVDRKPGNLHALARQVMEELEVVHPGRDFEVTYDGDTHADFDADRLTQVVGNLVANAVSYGRAGTPVRVAVRGEATLVMISVHNSGAPIPPERQRRIFEPMHQLEPATSYGNRSVGLGLYIVENIVAAHGGTVQVQSTAVDGTTFTVRLPRHAPAVSS
jgi:sigma-B regulation protein RsbU (phosphoserine phosphatase)